MIHRQILNENLSCYKSQKIEILDRFMSKNIQNKLFSDHLWFSDYLATTEDIFFTITWCINLSKYLENVYILFIINTIYDYQ